MEHARLIIDGTRRSARDDEDLTDIDPSTGDEITRVAAAQPDDVDEAIDAARRAQTAWADLAPAARGELLYWLGQRIRDERERLAALEARDTGKPLSQARADTDTAAQYFEFYGGYADKVYGETIPLGGDRLGITLLEPLGVTGHIIPWNYPLQIGARTIAPSLMVGNACVVKPAEEAPLTTLELGALALDVGIPPGVLNIVPGRGEIAGAHLAGSDGIDHLSFTGGLATGRLVMHAAAENVKPVLLELGGKSPSIVLDDADLDDAVPVLTKALIQNAGQTCSAGSRVVVTRARHDELVDRLDRSLAAVTMGPGIDDPDMGPLISAAQQTRVRDYVALGRAEGADIVRSTDDAIEMGGGYFFPPTLFAGVAPEMRIANEEIFGPVLSVLAVDDENAAIAVANGTPYALVASVWTRDVGSALRVARRVQAGQVFVNSYGAGGGIALPFGGSKHSGFGREKGVEAVRNYTSTKTVVVDGARAAVA